MQKFSVTVKTHAKQNEVKAISPTEFRISVTAPPHDGKANEAVLDELAAYLDIAPSRLQIISGHTSKRKIIQLG